MYLKVHPTVPEDESSLCYTCRFATVITGRNPHDQIVECLRLYGHEKQNGDENSDIRFHR